MARAWTPSGTLRVSWIAPRAGVLTGLTVCTEYSIGANGTYAVEVRKNGLAAGIAVTLAASIYKGAAAAIPAQFVSFAPLDEITLHDSKNGSFPSVGAVAQSFACWTK